MISTSFMMQSDNEDGLHYVTCSSVSDDENEAGCLQAMQLVIDAFAALHDIQYKQLPEVTSDEVFRTGKTESRGIVRFSFLEESFKPLYETDRRGLRI